MNERLRGYMGAPWWPEGLRWDSLVPEDPTSTEWSDWWWRGGRGDVIGDEAAHALIGWSFDQWLITKAGHIYEQTTQGPDSGTTIFHIETYMEDSSFAGGKGSSRLESRMNCYDQIKESGAEA